MVKKFSANYCNANTNFEIRNIKEYVRRDDLSYAVLCVVQNIIQRGVPTGLSRLLKETYGENTEDVSFNFFSDSPINWGNLIKGDDITGYNPANIFYYDILPDMFINYPFIPQLFVPEVLISEIIDTARADFKSQRVDFYCPEANLVIEIDGSHHQYRCLQEVQLNKRQ